MDLDKYLSENFDDILDNSDKYVTSYNPIKSSNKKVSINELDNNVIEIEKNQKYFNDYSLEYDDLDEKEYMDYNYEYYDNSYEYYDIDCDDNNDNNDDNNNNNSTNVNHDNYDNQNEDDYTEDIIDELYEKMHNSIQKNPNVVELNYNSNDSEMIKNDDGFYFFNLMNIFIKYYNNKYDKTEHFFSNINNIENDTTSQMELFYDAIMEYKMMSEQMELDNDEAMKQIYTESEPEKISLMFEKWNKQIYMFELDELKLFSPSLIVCLNYIFEKNILNLSWNIYNLRDN